MKKTLLFITALSALSFTAQAQTTLFTEDFEGEAINSNLSSFSNIFYSGYKYEVDSSDKVGVIVFNDNRPLELSWNNVSDLTGMDSLVVEYKLGTQYFGGTMVSGSGTFIEIHNLSMINQFFPEPINDQMNIQQDIFFNLNVDGIIDKNGYLQVKNVVKPPFNTLVDIIPFTMRISNVMLQTNNGTFQGQNVMEVGNQYCTARFMEDLPKMNECIALVDAGMFGHAEEIAIDDVKITGYTTVTGLQNELNAEQKELVKVYNQLGQERSATTAGELLFYHYSDGSIEKIYLLK